MSTPAKTFRDFAAAIMSGNQENAATVLRELLALDGATATAATVHFHAAMTAQGPAFMGKAMSLRTVKESGDDAAIGALLVDLFGLDASATTTAVAALRAT